MEKLPHNHMELQQHHSEPPAEATAAETEAGRGTHLGALPEPVLTRGGGYGCETRSQPVSEGTWLWGPRQLPLEIPRQEVASPGLS